MTRNLELSVKGTSTDAQRALAAAAAEMGKTARKADEMGDQFRQATRAAAQLDLELAKTAVAAKLLAKEFASSDTEVRASLKSKIDANRSAANELKRIRGDILGDSERDAKAAVSAFEKAKRDFTKIARTSGTDSGSIFSDGFASGLRSAVKSPEIVGIGVTIGALLAIPVGAAIGGAVTAGVAGGAAALAGFAAFKADTSGKLAAAGRGLIDDLNKQLLTGGQSAIEPLLRGINDLRTLTADIHIDKTIERAAKFIEPLAVAAGRFATYVGAGLDHLVDRAGPVVRVLESELPALGRSLKIAFDQIAGGSEGGARALHDMLKVTESTIESVGKFVGLLEHAYSGIRKFGDGFESVITGARESNVVLSALLAPTDALLHLFDTGRVKADQFAVSLDGMKHGLSDSEKAEDWAKALKDIETAAEGAAAAQTNLINSFLGVDEALVHADQGWTDLKKALAEGKHTLDESTTSGQNHRLAILDQVTALETLRERTIDAGGSVSDANGAFKEGVAKLRALAIAAGYSASEIDSLISKYDTFAAAPDISKTVTIRYHQVVTGHGPVEVGPGLARLGSQGERAAGGPVMAGHPYIVGEHRPELFVPAVNGMILPRVPDTLGRSGPSPAALWQGGAKPTSVNVALSAGPGGDHATAQLVSTLINYNILRLTATPDGSVKVA